MVAAAIDRPPASEAGFDGLVELFITVMFFDFTWDERARADNGELANKDIDELGHFIDR